MRIKTNRIYPYPIYSEFKDDYKNNRFLVDPNIEYDSENAVITLDVTLEDEKIFDLVENNVVGFFCHVECSSTKYRKMTQVFLQEGQTHYEIETPLHQLNDSIEIVCVLVAREDIHSFADDNLSDMYEGETIDFPKYATIGYTDTTEIIITKRIDVNGDVPSIFAVSLDESADKVSYDLNKDQIIIFLPKDQYDIYESYRGVGVRLKHMMLNIPVLVGVLEMVKKDPDMVSGYAWYNVMEEAFKKKGYANGFDDDAFKNEDSLILSQVILGEVSKDAFNEFDQMNQER